MSIFNDTFDDFTFTNVLNNIENCDFNNTTEKSLSTKTNNSEEIIKPKKKNDISFDDSLFFNSQDFTILRSEAECITTPFTPPASQKNKSTNSDLFDSPSIESVRGFEAAPSEENHNTSANSDIFDSPLTKKEKSENHNTSTNDIFDSPLIETEQPKESPQCKLSSWGLPESIIEKYSSRNITTMFPWQVECLNNPKILKNNANLVYSAPTSAGKTLVAEILAIKTLLQRSKKVIFILPFVSVVREKMFYFQDIFSGSGVRVDGFMGSYNPPGGIKSIQFAICTIEKANSLINNFLQEGTLSDIGAVIIDEMHLLGEPNRGYILELLLTKLRYITLKDESVDIQIVGMSATLPNLKLLAQWLDAELYVTNFRPIPLYEEALIGGVLYDNEFKLLRKLEPLPDLGQDTDNILQLCLETIKVNCSVLIFCPTKNWCENLAQQISTAFWKLGSGKSDTSLELRKQLNADTISEVLQQLKFCPVGLDGVLRKTVSFAVAFHHAGLTLDERDIIESAFRNGVIRVLIATSTLSSGVNLPARRVIIRTPLFQGKPLDSLTYRQMIGRAGRMGKDTAGESILVCQKTDEKVAKSLMLQQLRPIESCLEGSGRLKRAILEIVASGVASTPNDIQLFTKCTLLAQNDSCENPIDDALKFLVSNEFLRLVEQDDVKKYTATGLGKACLSSSIPPEDGLALFTELEKARQCFVLETELHLIYLVTPYSACHQWGNIDWMLYLNLWEKLPKSMKKVGELVGVRESYIVGATRGKLQTNTSKLYHKLLVHKRFFVSLALQDLVNEKPLAEVCNKFNCNRGMLQTLQLTASTFAGMVTSFSKQLGWSSVEILISQFQDRLHFGVSRDLLDLMRLPILNGKSARALFNGGLETLVQIANSDVDTIENIFHKVVPFESGKIREGESEFALKERNKFKNIWITGKEGLTEREAAELVLKSARDYLRIEMGLKEARWDENQDNKGHSGLMESDSSLFEDSRKDIPSLNSSGDFVVTSQDDSFYVTPKPSRKRQRNKENRFSLMGPSPSKKTKTEESSEVNQIEIIDVCSYEQLLTSFSKEVKKEKFISFSAACSEIMENKRLIGLTPVEHLPTKYTHKRTKVDGIALFWGGNTTYYLDLNKNEKSIDLIQDLLNDKQVTFFMFDSKEQIKLLKKCCAIDFHAQIEDPKVGDWLLEPEGREKSLHTMVQVYCPHLFNISQLCGTTSPKQRSSLETFLCWHLLKAIKGELVKQNIKLKVLTTEMSCMRILAHMELTGIGANKTTLTNLIQILNHQQVTIERKAYTLAGRRFSFTSSREVSKVLGLGKLSTNKRVLERNSNPLSDLVVQWRKINSTVTKMIQPLIRLVENDRIRGCCITHTATGRITMHEPNLQNVTKDFNINGVKISCRDSFIPKSGHVFVSADYCQLELRLLAHLSQDDLLCKIMRSKGDVFKSVAAKWNKIGESEVTDDLRQKAKQICYGIIYGMGSKALSEQLLVEESQATLFMETFRNAYPGVRNYIKAVIEECKKNGFVETLAGRRRYLPHINHKNSAIRSQAERQAVNTTIQGSAADIVKNTMVALESKCFFIRDQPNLVLHLHDELLYEVPTGNLKTFVVILKKTMEESVKLSIPFPVKVKTGPSWGQLTEYV